MPEIQTALPGETYTRQNRIQGLKIPQTASVVGLGGTGFWTASFLAMSGVSELILVDDDTVEVSNLNRLPFGPCAAGELKIHVTASSINAIRENVRVESHEMKIQSPTACDLLRGSVFCCTDNLKSQQMICAYCRKNGLPYQRIGYDGTLLNVSTAFPLSFEEATDEGGYSETPSWVIPAAVAAGLGVFSALRGTLCIMDEMGKLTIAGSSHIPRRLREKIQDDERDNMLDGGYGDCETCDHDGYGWCEDCEHERYVYEDDVADMVREARETGHETGDEEGYNRGYDEGITEGRRLADEEREE